MPYQDPSFDKAEYKRRRDAGMRGQSGPYLRGHGAVIIEHGRMRDAIVGGKAVTKKAVLKNTRRARRAMII